MVMVVGGSSKRLKVHPSDGRPRCSPTSRRLDAAARREQAQGGPRCQGHGV